MEKCEIKIKGKNYTVNFPNVEQLMEIEAIKMSLTNNKYVDYSMSVLKTHIYLLDMADAISYLSVLIPELKDDLQIKNWKQADPGKLKELISAYKNQFIPWYKDIFDDLYNYDSEDKKDGEQPKKET